jgi:hypothetical protein
LNLYIKVYFTLYTGKGLLYIQVWLSKYIKWYISRRVSYKKQELLTLRVGSVLIIILVSCVFLLCVFTFWVPCCDVRYDFRIQTMFDSSLPPVVCRRARVLFMLSVFVAYIVVSSTYCVVSNTLCRVKHILCRVKHILCPVCCLFFFVLCTLCCQFLWIIHVLLSLRYSLTFIHWNILVSVKT